MLHLRIVVPKDFTEPTLEALESRESVCNIVHVADAARYPVGDLILADVAREDASVVIEELTGLGIPKVGSIALEDTETTISDAAERAMKVAAGTPSDSVVWEEVQSKTSEEATLSGSFLVFMMAATLLSGIGIILNSDVLIVGGMVVGPEFGPIAAVCVGLVRLQPQLAARSFVALGVGFPLSMAVSLLATSIYRWTGIAPDALPTDETALAAVIADPGVFSALVALFAGVAGMLSLSTAKSGALIGVLISVATVPAAADVGVNAAYGNTDGTLGSLSQLGLNLVCIFTAGTLTLAVQRFLYHRRREHDHARRVPYPEVPAAEPTAARLLHAVRGRSRRAESGK
jgi:uncharacterized hydrophobic protein (TIGR00271 family)